MKKLIRPYIIPLTLISFALITKWWFVIPIDAPESVMKGFPLPFMCNGWHTSGSRQFFVLEFFIDIALYFTFWFVLFYSYLRFVSDIKVIKSVSKILQTISGIFVLLFVIANILLFGDDRYKLIRGFEFKTVESGINLIWDDKRSANFY
ncbi:MAG: hypothetical protein OCD76_12050 [Reichenbachiella sp.]